MTDQPIRIGVAGLGYWGPNLARNFAAVPGCELAWLCDARADARTRRSPLYPQARLAADLEEMLADPDLDAVALATPVPDHADHAVRVLEAGKHCFVEKPLAQSVTDAVRAVTAARVSGRLLMVGHLLEYHPGVGKLKELERRRRARRDLLHLRQPPESRQAARRRKCALEPRRARCLGASVPRGRGADGGVRPRRVLRPARSRGRRVLLSALCVRPLGAPAPQLVDPHKERRFTIVGARRMATFDDMALEGKVTVYDKGFDQDTHGYGEYITRSGEIFCPRISNQEPLRIECSHFVECIAEAQHTAVRRRERTPRGACARAVAALVEGVREDRRLPPRRTCRPGGDRQPGVSIGPGSVIHAGAQIGPGTVIGSCTVIHAAVRIGPDVTIEDCVVLGKHPRLRPGSSAAGSVGRTRAWGGRHGVLRRGGVRRGARRFAHDHRRPVAGPRASRGRRAHGRGPRLLHRLRRGVGVGRLDPDRRLCDRWGGRRGRCVHRAGRDDDQRLGDGPTPTRRTAVGPGPAPSLSRRWWCCDDAGRRDRRGGVRRRRRGGDTRRCASRVHGRASRLVSAARWATAS